MSFGWTPSDGWRGLKFGISTVADVIAELGQPTAIDELIDGTAYSFMDGKVQATFLNESPGVYRLRLDREYADVESLPRTLSEAEVIFPQLRQQEVRDRFGVIYCANGVELLCRGTSADKSIIWAELFAQ